MGSIFIGLFLLIIVIFILPIWLWCHYGKKGNSHSQLTQNEIQRLTQLAERAQRMQQRIKALEDILDAEHPNWRQI
ncbi:phage shock protein B [Arsenophonus endosymbiont of Bemisia tabaci Asia II 3]|nr:phage shock protein B [Arsenophonus endosymbiont of Bemisia tabaci Asia II 3]